MQFIVPLFDVNSVVVSLYKKSGLLIPLLYELHIQLYISIITTIAKAERSEVVMWAQTRVRVGVQ